MLMHYFRRVAGGSFVFSLSNIWGQLDGPVQGLNGRLEGEKERERERGREGGEDEASRAKAGRGASGKTDGAA